MSELGFWSPNSAPLSSLQYIVSSMCEIGIVVFSTEPRPVTTTTPALRTAENAWATSSPLTTPTVPRPLSAPWPVVTLRAKSAASSICSNAWVAPSSIAFSRLNATGSTAITWLAPAKAAPCTELIPIPPTPMMITVSPGSTLPALTAVPQPVPTPQPVRQATSSGMSSGIFTAERTSTVVTSEKVPRPHIWPTGVPSGSAKRKLSVSSQRDPYIRLAPESHRYCMPEAHQRQRPQPGRKEKTTWSPSLNPAVPGPTPVTTPAPSWPPQIG